jgi:uncharacterized membrane protein
LRIAIILEGVFVSLFLAASQVLLKNALNEVPSGSGLYRTIWLLMKDWKAWAAVVATGASALLWIRLLSRGQLTIVYPLLSLSYLFVYAAATIFLNESPALIKWVGIILICAGVALVNK